MIRPSVLCAVDFSPASRGALRYAAALAEHFYATLTVVTVLDRFLSDTAAASVGEMCLEFETEQALERFAHDSFPGRKPQLAELGLLVKVGTPADEILRLANETGADAIVMSTHGAAGINKLMFGSTTERVLRHADLPVIVTPAADPGPETLDDWRTSVRCVLAPIDLSGYSTRQLAFARGLSDALGTEMVVAHVVEPLPSWPMIHHIDASADAKRHDDARRRVEELAAHMSWRVNPAIAMGSGNPAAEIARIAREHTAGAIVMALHTAPGRQMGTVTYRLLCEVPAVVIACPPRVLIPGMLGLTQSSQSAHGHVRPA